MAVSTLGSRRVVRAPRLLPRLLLGLVVAALVAAVPMRFRRCLLAHPVAPSRAAAGTNPVHQKRAAPSPVAPLPVLSLRPGAHEGLRSSALAVALREGPMDKELPVSALALEGLVVGSLDPQDRVRVGSLEIPRLGIGTISWGTGGFGGIIDFLERTVLRRVAGAANQAESVVVASLLKGVTFVDTAERYGSSFTTAVGLGYGETEELVGRTLQETGLGGRAVVATKFTPLPWRATAESVVEACEASRQRLGVDVIDLYQIQMPDIVQPAAKLPGAPAEWSTAKDEVYWEGLAECYRRGIVANIGVSNYGPTLLRRAHAFFQARGVPLASNQINFSLLYRSSAVQATIDTCKELGVAVLAYYPLAMGVLTGKWRSSDFADSEAEIAETAQRASPLLKELETIAGSRGKSVSQVALNWVICKGAVPIPGARTPAQAIENAGALGWRLTPAEVRALEVAADLSGAEFQGAGFKRSSSKFVGYGYEEWHLD